jgi:hypothetical protein
MAVDGACRRFVHQRAGGRCEYCRLHQEQLPLVMFHVDHVISRQHGGDDEPDNLCESCHWCNFNKGPNLATMVDNQLVPLFNPRTDVWTDHFVLRDDLIVGITPVGRGTVRLLDMNDEDRRQIRASAPHSAE